MGLIAKRPILYGSRIYQPGDELPAADPVMAEAWVKYGSAVYEKPRDLSVVENDAGSTDNDQTPSTESEGNSAGTDTGGKIAEGAVQTDDTAQAQEQTANDSTSDSAQPLKQDDCINNAQPSAFTAKMKVEELREAGKLFGLTFAIGTSKAEMVEALNAAAAAGSQA